jgi:trimethylamine---corrinoid protein Co-methyltransferase
MAWLGFLSEEDIESIHAASLDLLDSVGIILTDPTGQELLAQAGSTIDKDRVYIPPSLVIQCLSTCSGSIRFRGRSQEYLTLGDGNLRWHNLGGARAVYDPVEQRQRAATIQDVKDATRLLDALDNVSSITPFFTPQDTPGQVMTLSMCRHTIPNTMKPLQGPGVQNALEVEYVLRMAEVIGPPSEVLTLSASPISPLRFPDQIVQAVFAIAKSGVAFGALPCPTGGTTAPITLAGALAQQNAEVLASIVLAQLVQPGLPIIYCGRLAMMEPRTGISIMGGVELGLASAATVQLGHKYHLPVNVYGFSSNAHIFDVQNGYERALNAALPALAGADELSGIGEMETGVMGSYAQMVMDNEIAFSIKRMCEGINVDHDTLGVEVVSEVMKGPMNFLSQKHTSRYLRSGEIFVSKLAECGTWETWTHNHREGMAERAYSEANRILREHIVMPLEPEQERELDVILASAEKALSI